MKHRIAFILIGLHEVDLLPLASLAEMHDVCQILLRWRRNIAVRRSQRVQLQIFMILHLSVLLQVLSKQFSCGFTINQQQKWVKAAEWNGAIGFHILFPTLCCFCFQIDCSAIAVVNG